MDELQRALADIGSIRQQVAAGTLFRGFGPTVVAATGALALVAATAQTLWPEQLARDATTFLATWIVTACLAASLIGVEMLTRSRRHHSSMADAMIINAVEHFLPAGAAGAAIGLVMVRYAPDAVWVLPGLWQVLVGVGILASIRFLPRAVAIAGGWYFIAGVAVLIMASDTRMLSPWAMAVPFAVGQPLLAIILHLAFAEPADVGGHDERH